MKRALVLTAVFVTGSAVALAQQVISAKSGLIHYTEGRVLLGNAAIESKPGVFPEIKENTTLQTELGRAEILLTPGVFLRVGENSALKMISNRLIDTRLELLSGTAVMEADEIAKDTAVTVVVKDAAIHLAKKGLYRFNGNPATLHVFDGEAEVETAGGRVEVKEGRMLAIDGMAVTKFDKDSTDALDRWSRRRAEYVAMANVSAANSIRRSGNSWGSSGWAWNPYFGMYTFIPGRGEFISPYGCRFWSPGAVMALYRPRVLDNNPWAGSGGGMGYPTFSRTSSGYSGAVAAAGSGSMSAPASHAPTTSAPAASSAPVSRSSGSAGGSHK